MCVCVCVCVCLSLGVFYVWEETEACEYGYVEEFCLLENVNELLGVCV